MAEAAVEENIVEPNVGKFFCHKCGVEIPRVLDDFTCPTCLGGFIEELDANGAGQAIEDGEDSSDDDDDMGELDVGGFDIATTLLTQVNEVLFGLGNERTHGSGRREFRGPTQFLEGAGAAGTGNRRPRGRRAHRGQHLEPFEHVIQDFVLNLTGVGFGPAHGPRPVRFFLGNPGDYAWGREGLDAIMTQLLNQMDVAGPPPLDKEKIKEIPSSVITQLQADSKLQCSVCWDDFEAGECVKKLQCEHFYHENCIVPWLELHGTCPICRKSLSGEVEEGGSSSEHTHLSDLSSMLRTASRWCPPTSTTSSSSATSSSTSTSANSSTSRQARPPSDGEMDFEFD